MNWKNLSSLRGKSSKRGRRHSNNPPGAFVESLEGRRLMTAFSFTINSAMTYFTASGAFPNNNAPYTAQGAGSLTAHYTGKIGANVTTKGNLITSIQFNGGSIITAEATGKWAPLGKLADYGMQAKFGPNGVHIAIANLVVGLSSSPLAVNATSGKFGTGINLDAKAGFVAASMGNGTTITPYNPDTFVPNVDTTAPSIKLNPKTLIMTLTIPCKVEVATGLFFTGEIVGVAKL